MVTGEDCVATGEDCVATGDDCVATGDDCVEIDDDCVETGDDDCVEIDDEYVEIDDAFDYEVIVNAADEEEIDDAQRAFADAMESIADDDADVENGAAEDATVALDDHDVAVIKTHYFRHSLKKYSEILLLLF